MLTRQVRRGSIRFIFSFIRVLHVAARHYVCHDAFEVRTVALKTLQIVLAERTRQRNKRTRILQQTQEMFRCAVNHRLCAFLCVQSFSSWPWLETLCHVCLLSLCNASTGKIVKYYPGSCYVSLSVCVVSHEVPDEHQQLIVFLAFCSRP
jgi:hypothetical protein